MLVAVEDDQVEIVDLLDEQFARRKGDQRQFVDRRAVLLFGRPQNGEVNEVDRGIRFQQIAPGPFAGMRLARYEQHAQVFANAVDNGDGAVVGVGDFAVGGVDRQFDDIASGSGDHDVERHLLADRGAFDRNRLAVDRDADIDLAALAVGGDDPVGHLKRLADKAEARRILEADAAVLLVLVAGDQAHAAAPENSGPKAARHAPGRR